VLHLQRRRDLRPLRRLALREPEAVVWVVGEPARTYARL
jgi:hypothetical protein